MSKIICLSKNNFPTSDASISSCSEEYAEWIEPE